MDSYNFTYKDVLKRYERIINKPSKFELRLLATILLIITIVNISTLCFADSEAIEFQVLDNALISDTYQVITENQSHDIFYANVIKGHSYTITMNFDYGNSSPSNRLVYYGFSNSLEYGTQVQNVHRITAEYQDVISITFVASDDILFLVSAVGSYGDWANISNFELVEEMNLQSVSDNLATNVGPSQIWDIFNISIDYIWVVVVAAFGIFLVVIAIRKMQKGKSEF